MSSKFFKECLSFSLSSSLTPNLWLKVLGQFTVSKKWKQAQCASRDKWISKVLYIYMHKRILFSLKKKRKGSHSVVSDSLLSHGL